MRLRKLYKIEMTMSHMAGSSVVEHWSAVQRVPDSIRGQSILLIVRAVWPNVTLCVIHNSFRLFTVK